VLAPGYRAPGCRALCSAGRRGCGCLVPGSALGSGRKSHALLHRQDHAAADAPDRFAARPSAAGQGQPQDASVADPCRARHRLL